MYKKVLSLSALALLATPIAQAQSVAEPTISPIVQHTTFANHTISAPEVFTLNVDKQRLGSYPIKNLHTWVKTTSNAPKAMPLILGVKGDKTIKAFTKHIPAKEQAYYLSVSDKGVVVAGSDERGLFYGLQTLRLMLADGKLAVGEVKDYPDVTYRGVVEGFYGTPWSYEDRLSQLDFYGRNKLNVYIYGPKDDPYHSVPNWRKPYPEQEAKQIKSLVEKAHDNGVIFYWAIHPGQDIKWNEEDRDNLIRKFEAMYQLGVRGFAVFFDDIWGEGTKADKQAELLNYIDNHFVKTKKDVAPLIMCPTEYNKAWSKIEKGYLPTLGDKLNKGIEIMWTGNSVVACIDKPDMQWINQHIKRKAYIWFNFPVSDFVRDHLLLGRTYGNSLDIAGDVSGFLSNPMEHAESSKIALYSIADYTWNMKAYNSEASWLRAMDEVFPEAPDALLTFAKHSSALGQNGHRFEREESEELQATLKAIQAGTANTEMQQALLQECQDIVRSANRLLASQSQPNMIDEMKPWLQMAKLVGEYGQVIMKMNPKDLDNFRSDYFQVKALQRLMYLLDIEANQNPHQPGVKYGSQHLLPALNAQLKRLVNSFNEITHEGLNIEFAYVPFTLTSNIKAYAHQAVSSRGKQISVSPSHEVVKWEQGASLSLMSKEIERLQSISFDLGVQAISDKLRLEALLSNGDWQTLPLVQKGKNTHCEVANKDLEGLRIKGLRLTYVGSEAQDFRLRNFRITIK